MKISGKLDALNEILAEHEAEYQVQEGEDITSELEENQNWNDGYRYFHPEFFQRNLDIPEKLKEDAEKLIQQEALSDDFKIMLGYVDEFRRRPDENVMMGQAELRFHHGFSKAVIIFDRTHIAHMSCDHWKCMQERRGTVHQPICVHQVAALLLLQRSLANNDIGDATNREGIHLLRDDFLLHGNEESETSDHSPCDILPVLHRDDDALTVSFRCGKKGTSGHYYKVKNIPDFIHAIERGERIHFGKKWEPIITQRRLTSHGKMWFNLMRTSLQEEEMHQESFLGRNNQYFYTDRPSQIKDELPLYGRWLDQFFDNALESGKSYECKISGYQRQKQSIDIKADAEDYRPAFDLGASYDEEGVFQGICLSGNMPACYRGENHAYFFRNEKLRRTDMQLYEVFHNVQRSHDGSSFAAVIGRHGLRRFYHDILPQLKEVAEVRELDQEVIQRYLPPHPDFHFYLDVEKNTIMARGIVSYQRKRHDLTDILDKSKRLEAYRDREMEENAVAALMEYFPHVDENLKVFFDEQEDAVYQLMTDGMEELFQLGDVRSTDRFRRLGIRKTIPLNIGIALENNLLNLSISSSEYTEDELLEILMATRQKKKYYRLRDGNFLKLDEDNQTLDELGRMMEDLQMSPGDFVHGKMHLPAYRALYMDRMLEDMADVYASRNQHFSNLIRNFDEIEKAEYTLDPSLEEVMRPYQKTGFRWLRTLDKSGFGGILADDMGLGKTLQVISVMQSLQGEGPSLIVAPASLVYNWREEIHRFAPELEVKVITGSKKERALLLKQIKDEEGTDVLVTSYDLLKRDIDEYADLNFRLQTIDEAQYIKNARTAAAKSVKLIHARTRIALTGTPIENRLSDLWSIFDYIMPGFLYDYHNFRMHYEGPIVREQDESVAELLKKMVSPFILRRLKKDVLKDLPDKLEEIQYSEMDPDQRRLYDGQVVQIRRELEEQSDADFRNNRFQILAELMRLRQICCDPALCFDAYSGSSAKRQRCIDLIQSAVDGGHKVLLFSQFTSMLDILKRELDKAEIDFYTITGATPKEDRIHMVNQFNHDDTPVFLISLKAGGTGLNLTGADIVIHYDPWWNFAAQNQATDRAHRIGQKNVVSVYKLIIKDTIEEKILHMGVEKQKLADDILGGGDLSASSLNRDDLLDLLSEI